MKRKQIHFILAMVLVLFTFPCLNEIRAADMRGEAILIDDSVTHYRFTIYPNTIEKRMQELLALGLVIEGVTFSKEQNY